MVLHDTRAEIPFEAFLDAKFPYNDERAASAVVRQGWVTSLNAAFCILHEISRPRRGNSTGRKQLREFMTDHLPELVALDENHMPTPSDLAHWLGPLRVEPLPVPHACTDDFLYAYWRRLDAYLDPHIGSGSSSFGALDNVEAGLTRLARDLEKGE